MSAPNREGPGDLRPRIEAVLRRADVPGASVAVVTCDRLVWADGFGLADLGSRRPATAHTVYHLFSGTKLFVATAVMQLVERGRIALDDPVARHLPEARAVGGVTIRQLLSHSSGLKESLRGLLATTFPGERELSAGEALRLFPLVTQHAPGTRVAYRNTNYVLLGALLERLTGRPLREHLEDAVLAPLGIEAGFTLAPAQRARAATGYMERLDPMRLVLRLLHPATARRLYGERHGRLVALAEYDLAAVAIGGLVGSMPAFARFLQAQLDGGAGLLTPEATGEMQRAQVSGAAGIMSREAVGLGWKVGRVDGRRFLNHEGGGAGFTTELRLYPDEGIGVAIGMNAMRMPATMRVAHAIAELVRDREVAGRGGGLTQQETLIYSSP